MHYDTGWNAFVSGAAFDAKQTRDWKDGWRDANDSKATAPMADPPMTDAERIKHLETELGRAYRALHAFTLAADRGESLDKVATTYHSMSIGAARRFVYEEKLDGSEYFIGKPLEVLRDALMLPNTAVK